MNEKERTVTTRPMANALYERMRADPSCALLRACGAMSGLVRLACCLLLVAVSARQARPAAESHFDKDLIAGSASVSAALPLANNGRQIVRNSQGVWFVGFDTKDGLCVATCDPKSGWEGRVEGRHLALVLLVGQEGAVFEVDDRNLHGLSMAMDSKDQLHVSWQSDKGVSYAQLNASQPWPAGHPKITTPVELIEKGPCQLGDLTVDSQDRLWLAYVKEGDVHVARRDGQWKTTKAAARGTVVGTIWDPPDSYNYSRTDVVEIPCREPVLVVQSNGTVHLAFNRRWEIHYARSADGDTWQPEPAEPVHCDGIRSTEERLDLAAFAHCFHPSMVVVRGHPLIVFQSEGMVDLDPSKDDFTRERWKGVASVGYAYHDGQRWCRGYIHESQEIMAKKQKVFLSFEQQWRPLVSLDQHGVPWVIWNDTTRRYNYFARWMGSGFGQRREWRGAFYGLSRFCTMEKSPPSISHTPKNPRYAIGTVVLCADRLYFCELPVPILRASDENNHHVLDLLDFSHKQDVETSLNQFKPYKGNPILRPNPDRNAWDGFKTSFGRVWLIDGLYRAQYVANGPALFAAHEGNVSAWDYGYAESTDGIHFVRKNVGLREFAGNRDNNIIYRVVYFQDEEEKDPAKRFKGIAEREFRAELGGNRILYSGDSIHWTQGEELIGPPPGGPHMGGPSYKDPYASPERRYKSILRSYNQYGRAVGMMFSKDMRRWEGFEDMLDDKRPYDAPPPKSERTGWIILEAGGGIGEDQIYGAVAWMEDGIYFAHYFPVWATGRYNPSLAISRDGLNWYRVKNGEVTLPFEPAGGFRSGMIQSSVVPFRHGEEIRLYYGYTPWHHDTMARSGPGGKKGLTAGYPDRPSWCGGLATMRASAWTYAQTANRADEGSLTTLPVDVADAENVKLHVNAEGGLEVELVDADTGQAIAGFSRGDCLPVKDGLNTAVAWKGGATLDQTRKRRISIRFHLRGNHTRFYSFRFAHGS